MSIDVIDSAKSYLTSDVIGRVSEHLGENPSNTQTAFTAALPAVLNGLTRRAAEPGGISSVTDLMALVTTPNRAIGEIIEPTDGFRSQLTDALHGDTDDFRQLLSLGSGVITSLFGAKAGSVADALASHSGIKQSSASSVLSIAGPIILGILGQRMAQDGTGIPGLSNLLSSQATAVQTALPVGLASLLGITPKPEPAITVPVDPNRAGSTMVDADVRRPAMQPAPAPIGTTADATDSDRSNRWLPWLMLALGAIALFFILRSCGNDRTGANSTGSLQNDSANVASDANTEIGTAIDAATDSAGAAVSEGAANLGAFFRRKLPSGVELNIPERGIENNLVRFIEDDSKPVDKTTWFNFDRLLFDTGKATLQPSSQEQLTNIANVLKAYPNVNIKIGGYTDNTGNKQANQQLSADRATTVMNELLRLGIDKSRLEAEGYGDQYPVVSNATEAGRAQNRRIAVRVTKK